MAEDTFKPFSLTISQIFQDGDPIYQIPDYQRTYSWRDEQIEKLWDDLSSAYLNHSQNKLIDFNYFLGSLIVVSRDHSPIQEVVDGQQRLTTLMILFNVLKNLYPNINQDVDVNTNPNVIRVGKIHSCVFNSNSVNRLRLNTHPSHQNDFSADIIDRTTFAGLEKPSKKDIEKGPRYRFLNTAFLFYSKLLELGEKTAGGFADYLFNQVKIIKIICSDVPFAIKLFQVLNDRGLDLSPADLLKSYLLSPLDDAGRKAFMADWQAIEQNTSGLDVSLTDLFMLYMYYLLAMNPKKSVVEELQAQFKLKNSNTIIHDFKIFVQEYRSNIWEPEDREIYSLWYLPWGMFWKAILLSAVHSKYPDYNKLKSLMRRFYYLYWIAGKTLSAVKQISFTIIGSIKTNKPITDIEKDLNSKLKEDNIASAVLKNLSGDIYSESWAKPLLLTIEYQNREADFSSFIELGKYLQAEHILPQKYKENHDWSHIENRVAERFLHSAGNLTILSDKRNLEAKHYSFADKISIYSGYGKKKDKDNGFTSFRISQLIVDDYNSNKYNKLWSLDSMIDRNNWFMAEVQRIIDIDTSSLKLSKDTIFASAIEAKTS